MDPSIRTDPSDPFDLRGDEGPALLDGGVGSELRRRGLAPGDHAWMGSAALRAPDLLIAVHRDYARAGARWATTATFGCTPFLLDAEGLDWRAAVAGAVRAARSGGARRIAGALSNAPPGLDPSRWPSPEREAAAYAALAEALADAGVDALALEMVQDLDHGGRLLEAAARVARSRGLPLWLGVSARRTAAGLGCFDAPERDLEAVLAGLLARRRPDAVLVMHTPIDALAPALAAVRAQFDGPVGARPELPYAADGAAPAAARDSDDPDVLVRTFDALRAFDADARPSGRLDAVGGCCGTGPPQIGALGRALAALDRPTRGTEPSGA